MDCNTCNKVQQMESKLIEYQMYMEEVKQQLSSANIKLEKLFNESSSIIKLIEYVDVALDIYTLLPIINDMLVGVLGISNCSIFLQKKESKSGGYVLKATTLTRSESKSMQQMVNDKPFTHMETPILYNREDFDALKNRKYPPKEILYMPLLNRNKQKIGFFLLEHVTTGFFEEDTRNYIAQMMIIIRLLIENVSYYEKLKEISYRDALTNAYNRLYYNKIIAEHIENYKSIDSKFIISIFDIDHFKKVNDTYGHLMGDEVLKKIVKLVKCNIRENDILFRIGGEEFLILFENTNDIDTIYTRLEKIRTIIQEETFISVEDGREFNITCSFGVTDLYYIEKENITAESIFSKADMSLYRAKETGRNKVIIYRNGEY